MKKYWDAFWKWYEKHKTFNVGFAALLFSLQLVHLYWLTADVVATRLFGQSYFHPTRIFETLILIIDYTEIPALITTSLVYLNELRGKRIFKPFLYLLFLNSQWLHIFWITDEFVVDRFSGQQTNSILPFWLAWTAILIDYLELPVIYDTLKQFTALLRKGEVQKAFEKLKED